MVRSDLGAAGVMFTLDTESGFDQVVFITAAYGLGETVVQGAVNPDEFYVDKRNLAAGRPAILRKTVGGKAQKMVFTADTDRRDGRRPPWRFRADERIRFSITDAEAEALARAAVTIERHYGRPMDIEWGRDGQDGELYILQARPETVKSQEAEHGQPAPLSAEAAAAAWSRRAARSARRSGRARCGSSARRRKWIA